MQTPDPFLAEVATHLIGAGGKRLRPTLTLVRRLRVHASGGTGAVPTPVHRCALTGAVAVRARAPRVALPRRRDRRGRDPPRRAQRERALEQHRRHPRRRLPPRPGVVAGGVARRRRRRRCSRRPSASCAGARCSSSSTSSTSTAPRRTTRPRSRARPPRCSRRRVASAAWCRASATPPSTRSPASAVTSACASRSSTTCSTSSSTDDRARQARGPGPPRGHLHAARSSTCCASRPSCATCSGGPLDPEQLDVARALALGPLSTGSTAVEMALGVARDHAVKARDALDGADGLDPDVCAHARAPRRRPRHPRALTRPTSTGASRHVRAVSFEVGRSPAYRCGFFFPRAGGSAMGLFDKAKQAKQSAADAMAQAGAMQQDGAGRLRHAPTCPAWAARTWPRWPPTRRRSTSWRSPASRRPA